MTVLTKEQVERFRCMPYTDLAVDQYDAPDMRLIMSRQDLEALCDSHEELRAQELRCEVTASQGATAMIGNDLLKKYMRSVAEDNIDGVDGSGFRDALWDKMNQETRDQANRLVRLVFGNIYGE